MKLKFLIPSALVLSALAAPAFAYGPYDSYYNYVPITGAQMTDMPSQRGNVTRTGSFLTPETGYVVRDEDYWSRRAYEQGYRDGYYDGDYGR